MSLHFLKGIVMWYMHLPFRIRQYKRNNERNLQRIKKKEKITVVFFASNLAMWRYQGLYEEMQKYPRFVTHIVLSPLNGTYTQEQIEKDINSLRTFFDGKGISYIDYDLKKMEGYDIHSLSPDLMLYPQPYMTAMHKEHRYFNFNNSLLCYYPYFTHLTKLRFEYDEDFHNRAWRLYYENEFVKRDANELAAIGDFNVRVVGSPKADEFMRQPVNIWKKQYKLKKRIIWAPHFTINGDGWYQNSSFLWMADFMLEIANTYKDTLQFAFKPHPRLLSELYNHKDWGKEKADKYYNEWQTRGNCQLETGDYVDLFMTSDAMIHDSGSFTAEYMYTGNPVMYTTNEIEKILEASSDFARKAYNLHYIGSNTDDILRFIDDVVMNNKDEKAKERLSFKEQYMLPPNNKSTAENTIDDILSFLR